MIRGRRESKLPRVTRGGKSRSAVARSLSLCLQLFVEVGAAGDSRADLKLMSHTVLFIKQTSGAYRRYLVSLDHAASSTSDVA